MNYTDEQIEAVISSYRAAYDISIRAYRIDSAARKAGCEAARAALEAVQPTEPLEDVLRGGDWTLEEAGGPHIDTGKFYAKVYRFWVEGRGYEDGEGTGQTIDEAIRAAVKAAQS